MCLCSSSAANETRTGSLSSQDVNNQTVNVDVSSTAKVDESLSLLSVSDHDTGGSMSSEIPYISPPPRFKSFATQAPTEQMEMPTRVAAEIPAKEIPSVNPVSCAYNSSLSNVPHVAVATKCNIGTVSTDVEGNFNGTVAGRVSNLVSTGSLSRNSTLGVTGKYTAINSSAHDEQNSSSLSPPKLTSFWEELDVVSDRPAKTLDDLFPINVDDDPPFLGFGDDQGFCDLSDSPALDHLVVSDEGSSSEVIDQLYSSIDTDVAFRHEQFNSTRSPPKSSGIQDNIVGVQGQFNSVRSPPKSCRIQDNVVWAHGQFNSTRSPPKSRRIQDKVVGVHGQFNSTRSPPKSRRIQNNVFEVHEQSNSMRSPVKSRRTQDNIVEVHAQSNSTLSPPKSRRIKDNVVGVQWQFNSTCSPLKSSGIQDKVVGVHGQFSSLRSPPKSRRIQDKVVGAHGQFNSTRSPKSSRIPDKVVRAYGQFNSTCSPPKSSGIQDNVVRAHGQSNSTCSPPKSHRMQDNVVEVHRRFNSTCSPPKSRRIRDKVVGARDTSNRHHVHSRREPPNNDDVPLNLISSKWTVDNDIEFNHDSPQKQRGMVFSLDGGKSATPDSRFPAVTSQPKAGTRRRKQLFGSQSSQVPSSTSGLPMSPTLLSPTVQLQRGGRRKK